MMRASFLNLVMATIVIGISAVGCSQSSQALARPCDAFRPADARALLHAASVKQAPFAEAVASATTVAAADNAKVAAAARYICVYRAGAGPTARTAAYQYGYNSGPNTFPSKQKFLSANLHPGSEEVRGVGVAAVFESVASESAASPGGQGITVLLSGGANFSISTYYTQVTKNALVRAAKKVAARL